MAGSFDNGIYMAPYLSETCGTCGHYGAEYDHMCSADRRRPCLTEPDLRACSLWFKKKNSQVGVKEKST